MTEKITVTLTEDQFAELYQATVQYQDQLIGEGIHPSEEMIIIQYLMREAKRECAIDDRPAPASSALLDDYLDRTDLAAELGVSERTLIRWQKLPDGLPVVEMGGRILYKLPSVRAWLDGRERRQ